MYIASIDIDLLSWYYETCWYYFVVCAVCHVTDIEQLLIPSKPTLLGFIRTEIGRIVQPILLKFEKDLC